MTPTATTSEIKDSILETVGETPLVRLSRIAQGCAPQVVAKVEYFNPGGSIKDRVAIAMIEAAERDGQLRPGGTIIEPTSGNTGAGLAVAARLKGYRVIAVMPDKMSREKIDLLRAYGAEVVVCPTDVDPSSPQSYYRVAERLTREIPGAFQPNQYANAANPEAHYLSTGPEIWRQTGGKITHLVAGVGTGGTITGTARYLKERNPKIEVIGADPVGSIYSNEDVHPYLVEGVGEDFWPSTYDPSLVDRYVTVSDRDSFLTTRRLAETEGLLVGGSCGLAMHAALEVAESITDPNAMVVVILPDGGRGYLSKIFNDEWMTQHGFLERGADRTVGDVLKMKTRAGEIPSFVVVQTHQAVRDAITLLHEHRVSQLPVVSADDPYTVVGSVGERGLLKAAMQDPAVMGAPISDVMETPFAGVATDRSGARGGGAPDGRHPGADRVRARPPGGHRHPYRSLGVAGRMSYRFATKAVHAGLEPEPTYGGVVPPIHQASTYVQKAVGDFVEDFDYSRSANPTRAALERAIGELEGGFGSCFSSGMAAEHALITAVCSAGDHVVIPDDLYGGTYRLVDKVLKRWGLEYTMVDQTNLDLVAASVRPETKLVWIETPTNPTLKVIDVAGVIERSGGAFVAVDNTFATPVYQRPLELGADAVVHSATKYLGGHSDSVSGAVVVREEAAHQAVRFVQNSVGAVPGPLDCFLVHRGLRTLHLRMAAHTENARVVSAWLAGVDGSHGRALARVLRDGLVPAPGRGRADLAHEGVLAGRVAGRGGVADRGPAGDDARVRRRVRGRRPGRSRAALVRGRSA